jgi:hypothetical protein
MKFPSSVSVIALAHLSLAAAVLAQSPSPYIISGQVIDESGQGVPGVRVCALSVIDRPGGNMDCGTSRDDGKFLIRQQEAGRFRLIYDKASDGYTPQLRFYRNPAVVIPEVAVDDQNRSASASVVLGPKSGVIRGKAIDASTNLPLDNIQLTLCRAADPRNCFNRSFKSADGKFEVLTSHEPFIIRIAADGFEDWNGPDGSEKHPSPLFVASAQSLDLAAVMMRRRKGESRAFNDAEKPVWAYLAAPTQLAPDDLIRIDEYPRATKLEWSRVEGAVSYKIEVDYCLGGAGRMTECFDPHPLRLKTSSPLTETSFEFNFVGAQPGRWRVCAIDKDGREGFKSPWRTFIYLK